ncbi:glycosyltransferase family 87 protein [Paludisphaera rhizosphaerae]|uniref:glycosyltransferase family 87 protein n=1 Tax=Paludisphaera rhizosphaerae TaxID=2711216 RepID=UPI0013EB4A27|nr:glycosyltransferase family 87 protein [Paludisphaera rhizosphaerae]
MWIFHHNWTLPIAVIALPFLLTKRRWVGAERALFAAAVATLIVRLAAQHLGGGFSADFHHFHESGRLATAGENPYPPRETPTLNPPTFLPLAKVIALIPDETAAPWWGLGIVICSAACTWAAWKALQSASNEAHQDAEPFPWGLAALVLLSPPVNTAVALGQISALVGLAIFGGIWLQNSGRPVLGGLLLATATFKPGTLIPALTLLLNRRGVRTFIGLAAGVLVLMLLAAPPSRWVFLCREELVRIAECEQPGRVNDIDYTTGRDFNEILSAGRIIQGLGVHDLQTRNRVERAVVLALTLALAGAAFSAKLRPPAAIATAASLGCLFLYHRLYDCIILAAPLYYCSTKSLQSSGARKIAFTAGVMAILWVLYLPGGRMLGSLARWSTDAGTAGRLVQAVVLPVAAWLLVFIIVLIVADEFVHGSAPRTVRFRRMAGARHPNSVRAIRSDSRQPDAPERLATATRKTEKSESAEG